MFTVMDPIPLVEGLEDTPVDKSAPVAPARLIREGRWPMWEVVRCPYCGGRHRHGTGEGGDDPRRYLGGRFSHCGNDEYRLVAIEGRISVAELDEHFPLVDGPAKTPRISFAPEIRDAVWMKSNGRCWYCGVPLMPFTTFTIDHIEPIVAGGSNDLENLAPCCKSCNSAKNAHSIENFRRRRGDQMFWYERNEVTR